YRLVGAGLVLEEAQRSALAIAVVQPVVVHEPFRFPHQRHELLADRAIDGCAVLLIEMVVTDDSEHSGAPWKAGGDHRPIRQRVYSQTSLRSVRMKVPILCVNGHRSQSF